MKEVKIMNKNLLLALACIIVCIVIDLGIYFLMKDISSGDMTMILTFIGSVWVDVDIIDYFKNKG